MRKLIAIGAAALLFGCSCPKVEDYTDGTPHFDITKFFQGPLDGYGMLQDRSGKVTRRFSFTMKGKFTATGGALHEDFVFDNGEKQSRDWNFVVDDEHHFHGTASDGVGQATGKQYGNVVNMQYVLSVPTDGKTYDISFDDWLYLQPNGQVLNQTKLTKFGFTVGKLTIMIKKK